MHKFKIKSKHPINQLSNQINDPSPTSGKQRRHPPPHTAHLWRHFWQTNKKKKKKKKIDPATWAGRDPPQRPRGEIQPPSLAIFVSLANQQTKKKKNR
jgi:hypothetical protein